MISFYALLEIGFWVATLGLILWWFLSMRKASKPRVRTPREQAELDSVRAAVSRLDEPAGFVPRTR